MKTPFVAHPPSILVLQAHQTITAACKAAGRNLGIPVHAAADTATGTTTARAIRPLVLVCDARKGPDEAVQQLAESIEATVVQVAGDEPKEKLESILLEGCKSAEARRKAPSP